MKDDQPSAPAGFFGTLKTSLAELPTLTAGSGVLLGVLALVGVTTDTLPEVALNAPLALAFGVALPLALLVGAIAFAVGKTGGGIKRRVAAATVFGLSLIYLIFAATHVSTQSTRPVVSAALTALPDQPAGDDVHYSYSATVAAERIQADESLHIYVWPASHSRCQTTDARPEEEDDVLQDSATGAARDGSVSRTLEGHVVLTADQGLCVVAVSPRRCGGEGTLEWANVPISCLGEREPRAAFAFVDPDPPPVPAAAAATTPAPARPTADEPDCPARTTAEAGIALT